MADLNDTERATREDYIKRPVAGFDIAAPQMALVYREIADALEALRNCQRAERREPGVTFSPDWTRYHRARIAHLVDYYMPSGSGFDSGTRIDEDLSRPDCLVFYTSFHHMDEHGSYDGWTEHTVRVYPCFARGVHLTITGRDRNGIKDHIAEVFS